ncbi:LOW QUALITY PROTEIN: uncharacterized protein LOC117341832 [Pecten maximus]|uniref:LOW QUALITY PROTEIN: uncharacterized protein LOC117341832 n=1 Tax=Pecten maximus TaxID=6579 RepID=UPI0014589A95|nr:LOW QUALITY PROTEIN: uncharacterized protein LOC117341832 [Pecten maximus]
MNFSLSFQIHEPGTPINTETNEKSSDYQQNDHQVAAQNLHQPAVNTVSIETTKMSTRVVSSWLCHHVCSSQKVIFNNPGKLSKPALVCFCVMFSLAVVYAVQQGTPSKHVLKVFVPQTSLIRRVRSYSENPDLSSLSINTSSLSLVTHVRLMDLRDPCKRNLTACDTYALCEAGFGSLKCRCQRGFYIQGNTCQACSTSVPEGFYMKDSCTADRDVVFRECSKCKGSEYQVAACTTTQNTMCLDVAFPLDHFKWNSTYLKAGNFTPEVHASKNVFVEKISGMKDVDTPVYIANNQQSMQFTFPRDSGLHVKVRVSDIFLVPEYIDLDHTDDSNFFLTDIYQTTKLSAHFLNIQNNYCRHPMPDHYKMMLELFRDFTSAARVVSCPSKGTDPPQCPPDYYKDDQYLERSYTTPCPEMPGNFSQLRQAPNIIYCSEDTVLLRETFRVMAADVTPLSFPSPECKGYQEECQRCVHNNSCNPSSGQGDACCSVSCFNKYACLQAFSSSCPPQPVKCAAGDLYLFSLEPKFDTIEQRFMCHLQYKKPKKLYKVEYFVTIPHMNFSSAVRTKVIRAENKTYHKLGHNTADYLAFFHDAVSDINDEVIVIGNRFQDGKAKKFKFHKLKEPRDFNRKKRIQGTEHRSDLIPNNVYSTQVQLERPFLYSSSGWSQGGCLAKNFSKIYAPQPMYKFGGIDVEPTIIKVKDKFEYQVAPTSRAPYIRFSLSGNESVLNYYDDLKTTIKNGSLTGSVIWDQWTQKWNITVKGSLNKCPAHLTMDVFDKFMTSYLGLYDVFVMPPENFAITIQLPRTPNVIPDIFLVNINDSVTCHRLSISVIDSPIVIASDQETSDSKFQHVTQFPWIPIIVTLAMTVMILLGFVVVAVVINKQRGENESFMSKYTFLIVPREEDRMKPDGNQGFQGRTISKVVMIALVVLYALYAIVFTFSMLLGVFYMVQSPLVSNLTIVSNTSAKIQEAVDKHFREMEDFETQQVTGMFNQTRDRFQACSHHLKENAEKIFHDVYKSIEKDVTTLYSQNGTLHNLLVGILEERSKTVRVKIDVYFENCNTAIQTYFESFLDKYVDFLRDVTNVAWLNNPRTLFMDQEGIFDSRLSLTEDVTEFLEWLEVEKVTSVLEVKERLVARLQRSLPNVEIDIPLDKDVGVIAKSPSDWTTIKSQVYQKHMVLRQQTFYRGGKGTGSVNGSLNTHKAVDEQAASKANLMSSMKGILLPVFICVFIIMDIFLLLYRFTWLRQMFQKAKLGAEEKIPTDSVAKKIHFMLTGHESNHPYDPLDNPYHYYIENKEDIWNGKNDLYLKFCRASPKSKEDILLEIWNHKKRQKQTGTAASEEECFFVFTLIRLLKLLYKHLISPILWRFVLVGSFVLIICILIKASNDLVTLETATFLMDTRSTLPQFHRQIEVTNNLLSDLHLYTNDFIQDFQSMVDLEVKFGNQLLKDIASQQKTALQSVLSQLCTTNYTLCATPFPDVHLADTLLGCNFLPVGVQYFKDFNDEKFMEYLHAELFPLVSILRQLLFNTCYILFAYACLMLICHIFIRVVLLYLKKTSRLPRVFMFLVSNANDCWKEHNVNNPNKDIYRSNSWIESCESGVVGDMDDHLREPNA